MTESVPEVKRKEFKLGLYEPVEFSINSIRSSWQKSFDVMEDEEQMLIIAKAKQVLNHKEQAVQIMKNDKKYKKATSEVSDNFQIFASLQITTGKTITLDVNHEDTIEEVKLKVQGKAIIPAYLQRLVYAGRELENSKKVSDYKIKKDSTVHVVMRMRGGSKTVFNIFAKATKSLSLLLKMIPGSTSRTAGMSFLAKNLESKVMLTPGTKLYEPSLKRQPGTKLQSNISGHITLHPRRFASTTGDITGDDVSLDLFRYERGDFGSYKLVSVGKVSPMRFVPEYIKKPEYYETGTPDATPLQLTILGQLEIEKLRDSCKLARYILDSVSEKAKVGVTTEYLDTFAHNLMLKLKAYPSPLNYNRFPKSICTSVNNIACHGIPDDRPLTDGDIVNIDITVYSNGFHGDCSETVLIGNVDSQGKELVEAAQQCLHKGISICGPDVSFRDIGFNIQKLAMELGFVVVPAFTGHGIGKHFHSAPDIYHIDYPYEGVMKAGIAFTVEPVISQGSPYIEVLEDGWTAVTIDGSRTAQFEHTVLITNSGVEILTL